MATLRTHEKLPAAMNCASWNGNPPFVLMTCRNVRRHFMFAFGFRPTQVFIMKKECKTTFRHTIKVAVARTHACMHKPFLDQSWFRSSDAVYLNHLIDIFYGKQHGEWQNFIYWPNRLGGSTWSAVLTFLFKMSEILSVICAVLPSCKNFQHLAERDDVVL